MAAALLAIDPAGLGGAVLRGAPGRARDTWVAALRGAVPPGTPMRRVPLHATTERLVGGLDLAATLQAGQRVFERGLLAEAAGGFVLLAMAERIAASTAGIIAAALDGAGPGPGPGVVAFDEGCEDEAVAPALLDRLAFHVILDDVPEKVATGDAMAARALLPHVTVDEAITAELCAVSAALGIGSLRAPILAMRAARAAAALAGRDQVGPEDAKLAAQLVLAPRATVIPQLPPEQQPEQDVQEDDAPPELRPDEEGGQGEEQSGNPISNGPISNGPMSDTVLAAAAAAIPAGLLAQLRGAERRTQGAAPGRMGQPRTALRGRPAGVRSGDGRNGLRLNLIETLRAAAPWQPFRGREAGGPVRVRRDDLRVNRLKQRSETTTIFVVDASGSQALNRLAEAKGAVELLLAECYARRDKVAVLAFRGRGAELLLPPTRSLVRAKRGLAGLPGGGGTPLAAGIDAGRDLADAIRRRGGTPALVLLTDGRGNVGLDGKGGREAAVRDTGLAACRLRAAGHAAVLIDTSLRPGGAGRALAGAMGSRYLALPYAAPATLARAVRPGPA